MGKQTYVVLQCCTCRMFQAQIDKLSRSFVCNICHEKQAYSRVFAKSNLAKDLRPLVAQYNARGVAEAEAAKDEECSPSPGDLDWEASELQAQQIRAGAIGDAWGEYADDFDDQRTGGREADGVRGDEEDGAERRRRGLSKRSSGVTADCSDWELDSDARRMEDQRARFAKRPRQKRRRNASGCAGAGRVGEQHAAERDDGWGGGADGAAKDVVDGAAKDVVDGAEISLAEGRHRLVNRGEGSASPMSDWGAYLSDE